MALLRFRLTGCVEEDGLRRARCGRDFVPWALDRLVLNGRTTLLASATMTPNVEPILLATPSSIVPSRFSDIGPLLSARLSTPRFREDHAGVRCLLEALHALERDRAIRKAIQNGKDNHLKQAWRLLKSLAAVFQARGLTVAGGFRGSN